MILYTEGSTDAQASEAEKIMHILNTFYPGHPWAVRVGEGFIFIRYLMPYGDGTWGMNIKTKKDDWSASNLQKKVVMAAGEWLERAGLSRGRSNGDEITKVEGVKDQKPVKFDTVVTESDKRDALYKQAVRQSGLA